MSRKVLLTNLSEEERNVISNELQIKIEESEYVRNSQTKYIYPYDMTDDHIYVPFSYKNYKRPERKDLGKMETKFNGELRKHQIQIKNESITHLNKYGSSVISGYPGIGKCLAFNTPVMMYDGKIKKVQYINTGDKLMGDDSTHRNVTSICRGEEQMYDIIQKKGDKYSVNESHILSLKISNHKSVFWSNTMRRFIAKSFNKTINQFIQKNFENEKNAYNYIDSILEDDILDISVKDYLKIPESIKNKLKGYKVPVNFDYKKVDLDPYFLGLWLGIGNSKTPEVNINTVDYKIINYLKKFVEQNDMLLNIYKTNQNDKINICSVVGKTNQNNKILNIMKKYNLIQNKHIPYEYKCNHKKVQLQLLAGIIDSNLNCFKDHYEIIQEKKVCEDICYIARSLGFESFCRNYSEYNKVYIYGNLEKIPVQFSTKTEKLNEKDYLLTDFKVVPIKDNKYYGFTLDGNHRFLLGDFTVTHNTCMAIYIAHKLKLKTLILVHRIVLVKQWKDSISRFCPEATFQYITTKTKKKECDFYIMNAENVGKRGREFYEEIGFVCVDELHLIMAVCLSQSLQFLVPRYILGLSATPYRMDGLDPLINLYFGKKRIHRKLYRKHTVYQVNTNFTPEMEMATNGRVNWSSVIDSQATSVIRNEMIIRIVKHFKDRVFLILVKRIEQGEYLVNRLLEEKEDVTSLIGKQQEFDQSSRILVGTCGKCSVGFDHPRLDSMIMAADILQYFIQVLGRVMRREDVEPIIFDLVDNNGILLKHYKERRAVYLEHGGTITNFNKEFPEFKVCEKIK